MAAASLNAYGANVTDAEMAAMKAEVSVGVEWRVVE